MDIFLYESLYRHIQEADPEGWQKVLDKFSILDPRTDLTFYYSPVEQDGLDALADILGYYTNYIRAVPLPEHLDIIRDLRTQFPVTEDGQTLEQFFSSIKSKIDALPDGIDKTQCQLYLLKEESQSVKIGTPVYYEKLTQYLELYNSTPDKSFDEEIISTAHYMTAEVFIKNAASNISNYTLSEVSNLYSQMISSTAEIEAVMDAKYPNEYMKNLKAYEQICNSTLFYPIFVMQLSPTDFVEMDQIFSNHLDVIRRNFKYGDTTWFRISYLQSRILGYFSHSYIDRGFELIDELYDLIAENLKDRDALGRSFHYRGTAYTGKFLCLLSYLRQFEKDYLNGFDYYKRKNQFNDLEFVRREEVAMRLAASRKHVDLDWSVIVRKLTG